MYNRTDSNGKFCLEYRGRASRVFLFASSGHAPLNSVGFSPSQIDRRTQTGLVVNVLGVGSVINLGSKVPLNRSSTVEILIPESKDNKCSFDRFSVRTFDVKGNVEFSQSMRKERKQGCEITITLPAGTRNLEVRNDDKYLVPFLLSLGID